MFAAAGRWDEATLVRKEMKDVGIRKGAGCSWVTAKNKVCFSIQPSSLFGTQLFCITVVIKEMGSLFTHRLLLTY
uniref:DYW domain-containing protein n=1 Tax=Salix viminalis TaxID=40686 RepID=A0A6N2NAS2_SALVM